MAEECKDDGCAGDGMEEEDHISPAAGLPGMYVEHRRYGASRYLTIEDFDFGASQSTSSNIASQIERAASVLDTPYFKNGIGGAEWSMQQTMSSVDELLSKEEMERAVRMAENQASREGHGKQSTAVSERREEQLDAVLAAQLAYQEEHYLGSSSSDSDGNDNSDEYDDSEAGDDQHMNVLPTEMAPGEAVLPLSYDERLARAVHMVKNEGAKRPAAVKAWKVTYSTLRT